MERTLSPLCGEARLYLIGTEEGEAGGTAVLIGYQLDGAPALPRCFGGFSMMRLLTAALNSIPEFQQLLSALEGGGSELMLYYPDTRGDTVTAAWGAF